MRYFFAALLVGFVLLAGELIWAESIRHQMITELAPAQPPITLEAR